MFKDWHCLLASQATAAFHPESFADPDHLDRLRRLLGPDSTLVKFVEAMDLGTPEERAFLATFPEPMLKGLQTALHAGLSMDKPVTAGFAFVAGPGYGLHMTAESSEPPRLYISLIGPEDH